VHCLPLAAARERRRRRLRYRIEHCVNLGRHLAG
jgi:hypothetical protein